MGMHDSENLEVSPENNAFQYNCTLTVMALLLASRSAALSLLPDWCCWLS